MSPRAIRALLLVVGLGSVAFSASLAVLPARFEHYADLRGLSTEELARRLSRFHGVACEPLNAVAHDGMLAVACEGGGQATFFAALPCEASFACDTLEIDAACWRPAGHPP